MLHARRRGPSLNAQRPIDAGDLAGRLLVASPQINDPRFERSVILLWRQDEDGSAGFVINRPHAELTIAHAIRPLGVKPGAWGRRAMLDGGPCQTDHGFVLFDEAWAHPDDDAQPIVPGILMSGAPAVLARLARQRTSPRAVMAAGHAGWVTGQLEAEIGEGAWFVADLDADLIFGDNHAGKWPRALGSIGIDPAFLSAVSGTA
jgi:putative transcriptional regulator